MATIGNFGVTKVLDLEQPLFRPNDLFPDLSADMEAEARRTLDPANFAPDGRLMLSFHCYVVRTERHTIVVDTCCGNHKTRPGRPDFDNLQTDFLARLADAGIAPESVDYVMCTHLHWDHVGWNTRLVDGAWVPTFPNARYLVSRTEYEFWKAAMDRGEDNMNIAGLRDSVVPVQKAGKLVIVEDDHVVEDGVWIEPSPGHSRGHVTVNIRSLSQRGVLSGDVIHHRLQLLYPQLSTRSDDDMELARRTRLRLFEAHADTSDVVMTAHFPTPSMGRIRSCNRGFEFDGI